MNPKFFPNEEFLSRRSAPVTNRRSRYPSCSSTKVRRVRDSTWSSLTEGITTPASELVPAASFWPEANTNTDRSRNHCSPNVVLELIVEVSWRRAEALKFDVKSNTWTGSAARLPSRVDWLKGTWFGAKVR